MRTRPSVVQTFISAAATGIAVLALTALAASASAAQTKAGTKSAGRMDITLTTQPTPPKVGDNQFEVTVKDADGKPIGDADVSVLFVMPAMPAMKMAEMRNDVKLRPTGAGKYTASGNLPMTGKWNVTVSVKKDGKVLGQKKLALTAQ